MFLYKLGFSLFSWRGDLVILSHHVIVSVALNDLKMAVMSFKAVISGKTSRQQLLQQASWY